MSVFQWRGWTAETQNILSGETVWSVLLGPGNYGGRGLIYRRQQKEEPDEI